MLGLFRGLLNPELGERFTAEKALKKLEKLEGEPGDIFKKEWRQESGYATPSGKSETSRSSKAAQTDDDQSFMSGYGASAEVSEAEESAISGTSEAPQIDDDQSFQSGYGASAEASEAEESSISGSSEAPQIDDYQSFLKSATSAEESKTSRSSDVTAKLEPQSLARTRILYTLLGH